MDRDPEGFYQVLGLQPGASIEDVKKAYTKQQIRYHPNGAYVKTQLKNAKTDEERDKIKKEFQEKSSKLNQAKSVLFDENKKKQYDSGMYGRGAGFGGAGFGGFGGFNFGDVSDIFDMFSGGGRAGGANGRQHKKVSSMVYNVEISFRDSFLGKNCSFGIEIEKICSECKGAGGENVKDCTSCNGKGKTQSQKRLGPIITVVEEACRVCGGEGKKCHGKACGKCNGMKYAKEKETISFPIRKGVVNGEKIIFAEKGHQRVGHISGDIVFVIKVIPNNRFERVGNHIVSDVDIPLFYALAGGCIYFPHVDDRVLEINIRPMKDLSKSLVLYGEGFKGNNGAPAGNLYLRPRIQIPANMDQKKLAEVLGTAIHKPYAPSYVSKTCSYDNLPKNDPNSRKHDNDSSDEMFEDDFGGRFSGRPSWFPF